MSKKLISTLAAVVLATTASCSSDTGPAPATAPELTAAVLRAATYTSGYVEAGVVRLEDGIFADTARRVVVFMQPEYAIGDLDGDGSPDAAVLLSTTTGGSGSFLDVAAVLNRDAVPERAGSAFLGDRVLVERIRIQEGEIQLDLTTHGPADPMCCPSVRATRRFSLEGAQLVELDSPQGNVP